MNKFELISDKFSFPNALALLDAAELAYEDEPKIYAKVKNKWGFDTCKFIKKNDTQCYVAKNREIILLAFRGTESDKVIDILVDLFAVKEKIFWGKAHKGFYVALDFVFQQITTTINEMRDNHQSIWITGHSLGGALATLAAARLVAEGNIDGIGGVYTYGQPRVGNKGFKIQFEKIMPEKLFRLTNYKDPVTLVPLKWWQYRHAGKIILFDDQGNHVLQASLWVRLLLLGIPIVAVISAFLKKKKDSGKKQLLKIAAPHALSNYRSNITKNMNI